MLKIRALVSSMKPGLSSLKFVRLVQPSIRVSTKAISSFVRGLIQLIRQRLFSVASSKPNTQTKLLSCQSKTNFKLSQRSNNFTFSNSKYFGGGLMKKQKSSRRTFFYFNFKILIRLLITKHRPAPH